MLALALGIAPNVPGFLTAIGVLDKGVVWPALVGLYNYAWFVGFAVSGVVYWLMMRGQMEEPVAVSAAAPAATFAQ
jgi:NCS1 family nucleobase:cation symporter-1